MREDKFHIIGVLAVVALTCVSFSCKPSLDRAAARSFSDSFVSDLDQNRMEEALKKVDPELFRLAGSDKVMAALKQARDVCDGPLTSQFQFDEIGVARDPRRTTNAHKNVPLWCRKRQTTALLSSHGKSVSRQRGWLHCWCAECKEAIG